MTNNEKKFWDILTNLFVGAEVKGKSGFINLMIAKESYFKKVKTELLQEINEVCRDNQSFKDEFYDKLYSFFHRYFSESGSIYYNYTPLFYNVYTKAYNDAPCEIKTFSTDYEQIISNKQDTSLFYKTQMLYYVKSDKIFKDLEIEIEGNKYSFNVSNMEGKYANEKKNLVYELQSINNKSLSFDVVYSEKGKTTKITDILKEAKKSNIDLKEEDLKRAFQVFEKQSNIDYFINKDAKKFLSEQLDMWIYQYMFSQEVTFDLERFNQIQDFKKVALKLINFIAQFENELVKIWNKPRFVLNANIVVTLDKLQAKNYDINKITNHPNFHKQQAEWEELGINQGNGLVENEYLPIDTKYFSDLKEEIEELFNEDEFDGLLIKSENYQALNTIQPRFKGKIDLIYIDPPFNTGDDFAYIDRFQDSTWLSLMENRLELAKDILSKKGSFYLHLDHNADYLGRQILNKLFGLEKFQNKITWRRQIPRGKKVDATFYSYSSDYIYIYADKLNSYWNIIKTENELSLEEAEKKYMKDENGFFRTSDPGSYSNESLINFYNDNRIYVTNNGQAYIEDGILKTTSGNIAIKYYREIRNKKVIEETVVDNIWNDIPGMGIVSQQYINFATQKPEKLLERVIKASSNTNSIILDYHLGSGTTVATAQKLGRKYVGVEMGEHFYTIVIPRMKKILSGIKSGISKDVEYQGGGIFKYYELEQYEQILRSTKYSDVPLDYLESKKSDAIKDCFLFDEKLSQVIISKDNSFHIDLSKLYPNIDLKETIHNLTGKRPKQITDTKVIFEDKEFELLEILKPLLVW